MSLRLLEPRFVERIWGTTDLSPLFPKQDRKIGEVWFDAGSDFPVLIKFLFTSAKLSIQVHPDDAYAGLMENSPGKTEMWHILSAAPGSTIALGFRKTMTEADLRTSILDGTVEQLLNWVPVKAGETYYAEAGTVHAIGAGIALCEIQQNSDVTYRLYDYGRPRELHLEKGLAVAKRTRYDGRRQYPVHCDHFHTELLAITARSQRTIECDGAFIVIEGSGRVSDRGVKAGDVCLVRADSGSIRIEPDNGIGMKLLHVSLPAGSAATPLTEA